VAWIEEIGEVANVMSGLFAVFAGESITCCKSNKTRVVNQISYKMIICVFLCVNIIDCSLILFGLFLWWSRWSCRGGGDRMGAACRGDEVFFCF
jgi:hypothetical protein